MLPLLLTFVSADPDLLEMCYSIFGVSCWSLFACPATRAECVTPEKACNTRLGPDSKTVPRNQGRHCKMPASTSVSWRW